MKLSKINIFLLLVLELSSAEPQWVKNGGLNSNQYIYGIGSFPKRDNLREQVRFASMFARADLSSRISTFVETNFKKELINGSKEIEFLSSQTSKNLLKFSFEKDRWIDEKGDLFILIAIDKRDLKD
jgi:hypothetical protein